MFETIIYPRRSRTGFMGYTSRALIHSIVWRCHVLCICVSVCTVKAWAGPLCPVAFSSLHVWLDLQQLPALKPLNRVDKHWHLPMSMAQEFGIMVSVCLALYG